MRLFSAVLLAPPLATIPGMMLGAIMRGWEPEFSDLPVFLLYVPFAYAGALVLGVPLHLVLRRRGWTNWLVYEALGTLIAGLVAAGFKSVNGLAATGTDWIAILATGAISGLIFRGFTGPESNFRMQRTGLRPAADPDRYADCK